MAANWNTSKYAVIAENQGVLVTKLTVSPPDTSQ